MDTKEVTYTADDFDIAYSAFVDDCLSAGIDPESADAIAFAFGEYPELAAEDMTPAELTALIDGEDIPF